MLTSIVSSPYLKSQLLFHAEMSQELFSDTTLEIWRHHEFCGISMRELLLLHVIIKTQIIRTIISSHVTGILTK